MFTMKQASGDCLPACYHEDLSHCCYFNIFLHKIENKDLKTVISSYITNPITMVISVQIITIKYFFKIMQPHKTNIFRSPVTLGICGGLFMDQDKLLFTI